MNRLELAIKTIDQLISNQNLSTQVYNLNSKDSDNDNFNVFIEKQILAQAEDLQVRLREEYYEYGPLSRIIKEESISEIIINSPKDIWQEKNGTLEIVQDSFLSRFSFERFIRDIYLTTGQVPSLSQPFINGTWQDFRVHAIFPYDKELNQHRFTLRRQNCKPWSFAELESKNWSNSIQLKMLRDLIQHRANLLIVGATNSGKTSVLSACLNDIPMQQRTVILEDTKEIVFSATQHTRLLTRNESETLKEIDLHELLKQSLRMRPDRLVIGEIRGHEASSLLLALSTGHSGSMGTLHARSAQEAILRLEMLIQMAQPEWSLNAIRRLIFLANPHIVVTEKRQNQRQLEGIYRLASLEDFGFTFEKLLH